MNLSRLVAGFVMSAAVAMAVGCSGGPLTISPKNNGDNVTDAVNTVLPHAPSPVSPRARALHATIPVTDLHADPLLWNRDLLIRNTIGHVDFPRLKEGGYALQLFSVVSASPRGANYVKSSMANGDAMRDRAIRVRAP